MHPGPTPPPAAAGTAGTRRWLGGACRRPQPCPSLLPAPASHVYFLVAVLQNSNSQRPAGCSKFLQKNQGGRCKTRRISDICLALQIENLIFKIIFKTIEIGYKLPLTKTLTCAQAVRDCAASSRRALRKSVNPPPDPAAPRPTPSRMPPPEPLLTPSRTLPALSWLPCGLDCWWGPTQGGGGRASGGQPARCGGLHREGGGGSRGAST